MISYINRKVFGLPKPKREGFRTRYLRRQPAYVHKVCIKGCDYYKVHLKRSGLSKIKYFKTKLEALLFVDLLTLNPYL